MTAEGIQYVATVAACSMAVVCLGVGFVTIYGAALRRREASHACNACMDRGFQMVTGDDGRITGERERCECRRYPVPVEVISVQTLEYHPGSLIDTRA